MTEKRFVGCYAGRTIKRLIGIKDIETNKVCVTIEENIRLLNEINDENEQLKKVFRELITSGYWDEDYLTEQDWNDLKRYIENVFEKVMMND